MKKKAGGEMKKIWLCILLIVLCGCTTAKDNKKTESNQTSQSYCDDDTSTCSFGKEADMSAYEGFDSKDSRFEESDMEHLLATFDQKKSGIFYLGYPSCPWCIEALPVLNEVAKENDVYVAYVRTRDDQKELIYTEEQKQKLISLTSAYLEKNDDGEPQLFVPFVLVVKDGKAISGHVGTVDGHDAHERTMKDEEKEALHKIYMEMLNEMKKQG